MINTLFTFASANELILEIDSDLQNRAWESRQSFSHSVSGYRAYINELCLGVVLPWLQAEWSSQAKIFPSRTTVSSIWEFMNGIAVDFDEIRLILVPSEAMDGDELRVTQEWVDIPSWAGDYYLGVRVEPDDGFVQIWGYCTHTQLKDKANFDSSDRTYSLPGEIMADISTLAVNRELCTTENTRTHLQPLPNLELTQATNLINRLANPTIITPRLEIPFHLWGNLMAHGGWRENLYRQRLGQPEQFSVLQWLNNGVSQIAQQLGWQTLDVQLSAAGARSVEQMEPDTILARQLAIAGQAYELRIIPRQELETTIWRFELRNTAVGAAIPGGFKLRLLTEDLQPFPNNEDIATIATEQLFVEVALEPGEGIVWEIEPMPENCDREILKF